MPATATLTAKEAEELCLNIDLAEREHALSPRCREILGLLYTLLSERQIAEVVGIKEGTVKVYLSDRIYPHLRANGRIQLMSRRIATLERFIEAFLSPGGGAPED